MQHDSLIFDLDGTLWDSTQACAEAWTDGARKYDKNAPKFTAEDLGRIMGMTFDKAVETLLPNSKPELRTEMGQACYEKELEYLRTVGTVLYEGVGSGLVQLAKRYPLYIVSNCLIEYLDEFLAITQFGPLFKDSECFGRTGKNKGHNIKSLVEKNGLKKPAYIGDTGSDQEAARFAGVPYYHVDYGFGRASHPCQHFKSFEELTEYFLAEKP